MLTIAEEGRNSNFNSSLGNSNLSKTHPKEGEIIEPDFNLDSV